MQRVLQEIEAAQGWVDLAELSRRLGVEPGALEGMLAFLERKGRLKLERCGQEAGVDAGAPGSCGRSCPGVAGCPFVMDMPRGYSLAEQRSDEVDS